MLVTIMHFTCATFNLGTCSLQCNGQTVDDGSDLQTQLQGPSGKRGPVGPIGPPGPKGDAGNPCDCLNGGEILVKLKLNFGKRYIWELISNLVMDNLLQTKYTNNPQLSGSYAMVQKCRCTWRKSTFAP